MWQRQCTIRARQCDILITVSLLVNKLETRNRRARHPTGDGNVRGVALGFSSGHGWSPCVLGAGLSRMTVDLLPPHLVRVSLIIVGRFTFEESVTG
jgi:hypothetical protein